MRLHKKYAPDRVPRARPGFGEKRVSIGAARMIAFLCRPAAEQARPSATERCSKSRGGPIGQANVRAGGSREDDPPGRE
jgi:hypothetical protein